MRGACTRSKRRSGPSLTWSISERRPKRLVKNSTTKFGKGDCAASAPAAAPAAPPSTSLRSFVSLAYRASYTSSMRRMSHALCDERSPPLPVWSSTLVRSFGRVASGGPMSEQKRE